MQLARSGLAQTTRSTMGTEQSRAWEAREAARRAEFDRQAQQFLEDSGLIVTSEVLKIEKIYWDADGNLRYGETERNRDAEVLDLLSRDNNEDEKEARLWMIIPSRWVREWLLFAHLKTTATPPGPIDMRSLLQQDASVEGGWRPKNTLRPPGKGPNSSSSSPSPGRAAPVVTKSTKSKKPEDMDDFPGHYRRISYEAWQKLVELYDISEPRFAMAVRGTPYHDLKRWRVFKDPLDIDAQSLPEGDGKHWRDPKQDEEAERGLVANMRKFLSRGRSKRR